jgi:hypothetical protein
VNLVPSAITERESKTFIRNYRGEEYEWDNGEVFKVGREKTEYSLAAGR